MQKFRDCRLKNMLWIVVLLAKMDYKVNMKTKSNIKSQNENFKM